MLENVTIWGEFHFDLVKSLYVVVSGAFSAFYPFILTEKGFY